MKAVVVPDFNQRCIIVKDKPRPTPGKGEVLVELKACGCCHTDIHAMKGDWSVKAKMPLIPGHEGVGVIVELGEGVSTQSVGERVGIPWLHSSCGSCEYCLTGWETLCYRQTNSGYSVDGCWSQYVTMPATHCVPIPPGISFEEAAPLLCAGVTVYKAIKESEVRSGQFICIIGAAGGLGHLAVQYARVMGCRVIALDIGEEKMNYLRSLGAECVIDMKSPDQKDPVDIVREFTNGGAHAVINLATHPSAYDLAIKCARRKGFVTLIAMPKGEISLDVVYLVLNRITIRGSIVGTREDMREAIDFAARGLVKCDIQVRALEEVNEVIEEMMDNKIKGRVVFRI